MTSERQFDALLRSWLEESAPSGPPQGLLESVLSTTAHSQPRPAWLVGFRGESMPETGRSGLNRFAPFAVAATALVLVALLIGIGLILRSPNVGPSPIPGPTHRATPEATAHAAAWTAAGSMIEARFDFTATLLRDGRVLVAGGSPASRNAELYDPATGSWTATGELHVGHVGHTATLLSDGRVLVVGGQTRNEEYSAELYDPVSGTWSATADLINPARAGHTATLLADGRVLVAGGGPGGLFNPISGTWSATGAMDEGRRNHAATLLPDGRVLVAGGTEGVLLVSSLASAELYDPVSGTWSATGSMSEARRYVSAILMPDGTVLVAGGGADSETGIEPLGSTELYDPDLGNWTIAGSMNVARGRLVTYTLLPDGTVLAAGGQPGGRYLASAEVYDPVSRTWTITASMDEARRGHTATLLPDGTVLVAGGYNGSDPTGTELALASAELYDPGSAK
jgi:hypothetical protein